MSLELQQRAANHLIDKGVKPIHAAGIVANIAQESNLNHKVVGDGGRAYGLVQWHPDRQANFKKALGKDIRNSTLEDQLDFVLWELNNTESGAGAALAKANTYEEAVHVVRAKYERPANKTGEEDKWRTDKGRALMNSFNGGVTSNPTPSSTSTEPSKDTSSESNDTPSKSNTSRSASEQFDDERKANLLNDANFKTYLDGLGVDTTNLSYKNIKAFKTAYVNKDATEANAAAKAQTEELYNEADPTTKAIASFSTWLGEKFSDTPDEVAQQVKEGVAAQSRDMRGVQSGVANTVGNVVDVFDKPTDTPSVLKQYSKDTDAKFDDGSTRYAASKFVGEVAPALMVPTVGTGSILGTIATNAAIQGGAAYAMSNDEDRNTNAGIAGVVGGSIPVLGKAFTAAKAAGASMLPSIRAGAAFERAGINSANVNTAMATQLPQGVKPTLSLIDNVPDATKLDDLVQTARSQLDPKGNSFNVGSMAAQQYDQTLANNVDATKSALNPTGLSSVALGDDIKSIGTRNLDVRASDLNSKITSGLNDPNLATPINHSLKDDVFAAQLNLQNKNGSIPSELKNFVNIVNTKVGEVTTLKEGVAAIRELERNFAKQPEIVQESLAPYLNKVKETMGATRSNNGLPFRPMNNVPESRAKLVLSDIQKLTDTENTKVNLRDVAALKELEELPVKPSKAAFNGGGVLPTDSTKNFVGAKQSEKTFAGGKVKDKDFLNETNKAERELVELNTPEIKNAVNMLAKDLNNKGFVDQKIVEDLSGKVGKHLDKLATAAVVSPILTGNIWAIAVGVLATGGKFSKPTIAKEIYTKMVASHIVKAGVNPKYAEELIEKYLKTTKGNAQLEKLTRKLSPVIGQAIIQGTDQ